MRATKTFRPVDLSTTTTFSFSHLLLPSFASLFLKQNKHQVVERLRRPQERRRGRRARRRLAALRQEAPPADGAGARVRRETAEGGGGESCCCCRWWWPVCCSRSCLRRCCCSCCCCCGRSVEPAVSEEEQQERTVQNTKIVSLFCKKNQKVLNGRASTFSTCFNRNKKEWQHRKNQTK